MLELAKQQIAQMKYQVENFEHIRSKNGIHLYRIYIQDKPYVLKCFEKEEDTREIENYRILNSLSIPTIQVINNTANALLLEDISSSETLRLGIADDLLDEKTAVLIAKWYKLFHSKGKQYVITYDKHLYDETDVITLDNLNFIKEKSETTDYPVWQLATNRFADLRRIIDGLERTLAYNDFYWTNLIVAKDGSQAFMFDYNLLGKGYAYGDILNVCSSLSDEAETAFLQEYGEINQTEKNAGEALSTLIGLYYAYQKVTFPAWGKEALAQLRDGRLYRAINVLLNCTNKL